MLETSPGKYLYVGFGCSVMNMNLELTPPSCFPCPLSNLADSGVLENAVRSLVPDYSQLIPAGKVQQCRLHKLLWSFGRFPLPKNTCTLEKLLAVLPQKIFFNIKTCVLHKEPL